MVPVGVGDEVGVAEADGVTDELGDEVGVGGLVVGEADGDVVGVVVADGVSDQSQRRGLTFSRVLTHSDGRPMTMIHHTNGDTPPYLLCGALVAGALALKSRRTAFC